MAGFVSPNAQRDLITVTVAHPNAEILRAIADGKAVQWQYKNLRDEAKMWRDYTDQLTINPMKRDASVEWRIKPVDKVYYFQMLKNDIGRPVIGSINGYDIERITQYMKRLEREPHSPIFRSNGLLAFTHTDDGTITKIEYFTMKELRDKGWL